RYCIAAVVRLLEVACCLDGSHLHAALHADGETEGQSVCSDPHGPKVERGRKGSNSAACSERELINAHVNHAGAGGRIAGSDAALSIQVLLRRGEPEWRADKEVVSRVYRRRKSCQMIVATWRCELRILLDIAVDPAHVLAGQGISQARLAGAEYIIIKKDGNLAAAEATGYGANAGIVDQQVVHKHHAGVEAIHKGGAGQKG